MSKRIMARIPDGTQSLMKKKNVCVSNDLLPLYDFLFKQP